MSLPQLDTNQFLLQIGGLQTGELLIIAIIAIVIFFGARKIPEIAKSLGKASGEFEKGKVETKKEIDAMKKTWEKSGLSKEEDHEKLINAAKQLGIETEGKTESELKEEIQKALLR